MRRNACVNSYDWDPFLSASCAKSLISITIRTWTHADVRSQTIIYPKPNPNQKNLQFGPQIPNPITEAVDRHKGRLSAALVLGLETLDYALYLTQWGII